MNRTISENRPTVSLVKRSDQAGKGIAVARLSNSYLQDQANLAGFLKIGQYILVVGMVVLVGLLANFSSTSYRVFATTAEGKLTTLPGIDKELGDNAVLLWVSDLLNQTLTMGFHDYQLRLQEIRPFFTDRGWESFNRYHRASLDNFPSIRIMLENDHLVMWPKPLKPPQINRKEVVGGVFTYEIRVEMQINRKSSIWAGVSIDTIDLTVERVSAEVSPSGLAIARWRATRK